MLNSQVKNLCGLLLVFLAIAACAATPTWLEETGRAAGVPADIDQPFLLYVEETRRNIEEILAEKRFISGNSPYLGNYSSREAAEMRAPFQIPVDDNDLCREPGLGAGKGFLLIHGLTDSPYLMRSIAASLQEAYPCGLIRAVLLPGHGTVVGDSLAMKHQEWMKITQYGVRSFDTTATIQDLYVIGFSTGGALAVRQLQDGQNNTKIRGLILLSAALKAGTSSSFLAPYLRYVKDWLSVFRERDAARYESFSVNAGAEFYRLTKNIMDVDYTVHLPVLMAVSADDATIDAEAARWFFCNRTPPEKRALLWYESRYVEKTSEAPCSGIATVSLGAIDREYQGTSYRFANYAHTALTMSPADQHYGVNGKYHDCKAYDNKSDLQDFENCQRGSRLTIFGEKDIKRKEAKKQLGYDYWRRGTFNPDYPRLEKSIICFVAQGCDVRKVAQTLND